MANNGFDSFGGFDDMGGFDDNSFSSGNDFDLDTGVQPPPMDNFDFGGNTGTNSNNEFSNSFDNQGNQFQDTNQDAGTVKKSAIIAVIVGVIGIIIVILIATAFGKNNDNTEDLSGNQSTINSEQSSNNANTNVDNIMNDGNNSNSSQSNDSNKDNSNGSVENTVSQFDWVLITDSENVSFNDEYMECTFTITSIEHIARPIDTNNNLVVVTRLQGSLSGLAGTYELYIPYNKGIKLVVGNRFTVYAQIGTYNNKTVVGEIKYY